MGRLENHIAEQGAKDGARLCVLNGPVFTDDDKPLKDELRLESLEDVVL